MQSNILISNTGTPQGTVLAPFLFTIYTSDIRSSSSNCHLIKFADDTALLGLIHKEDANEYTQLVNKFVEYCNDNFLVLNVSKTKELIIDFRIKRSEPEPVLIKNDPIQRTDHYKYLGVIIDNCLTWTNHIDSICKKLSPRMYCLRKMNKFQVNREIMVIFYDSIIASVWKYVITCWGGNAKSGDKRKITTCIKQAHKVIGHKLSSFDEAYEKHVFKKLHSIMRDNCHPLFHIFHEAKSARSGRMLYPAANTNRHKSSFVVRAMKLYNDKHVR